MFITMQVHHSDRESYQRELLVNTDTIVYVGDGHYHDSIEVVFANSKTPRQLVGTRTGLTALLSRSDVRFPATEKG